MRDMRRINKVWEWCNFQGAWYTFAYVGSGKNRLTVTLHAGGITESDYNRIGKLYFPKEVS